MLVLLTEEDKGTTLQRYDGGVRASPGVVHDADARAAHASGRLEDATAL
jgi:hypothetical protein